MRQLTSAAKILVGCCLTVLLCSCATFGPQSKPTAWQGEWIAPSAECGPNSWACYRKQITLDKTPQHAVARIACDSKYWLWVNGEGVVFEGQAKRGPTPNDTYYDTIDLAPYLKAGSNTVAALVWYWGKDGFSHNSSGQAGFLFDAQMDGKSLISDASWKAMVHPAYGSTDAPHPNFRLPEHNIRFDAQKAPRAWQTDEYNDDSWADAVSFGTPPVAPWNNLYPRITPQWYNSGLRDYPEITEQQDDNGNRLFTCRLPYNSQITPYLKVAAKAGNLIDIRTDDYNVGGALSLRAEYITTDGLQEYESLGWMNGHEVRYTIPEGVEVIALMYRQTGYGSEVAGAFQCDDKALNTLWKKALCTLYVTMRDTYMDCPERERALWWGDAVNEMGEAFYVFDAKTGPLLTKKGMYELVRWQRPDKSLYAPIPAGMPKKLDDPHASQDLGTWYRELPMQILATVGWYGFWTYYQYTGDAQTIEDVYPAVRDYLSLWQLGDDGLVSHRTGEWDWPDWGENHDIAAMENAWLYLALKAAVQMAALTGQTNDIAEVQQKMESIKAAYNTTFWQGMCYHSPSHKGQTDDRANALAVVAGLAEPDFYPAIKEVLRSRKYASPYMEKYVLEALYQMDAPYQAIERMKERYAAQIESPLTTLWEVWDFNGGTYNHGWSGGPLTLLSQYAAGVAPITPGFKKFAVIPQMGPLQAIDSTVPTPYGSIELNLRQDDAMFLMNVTVPKGTSAIVSIPRMDDDFKSIRINDKRCYDSGKPTFRLGGPKFESRNAGRVQFSLTPGKWMIVAE